MLRPILVVLLLLAFLAGQLAVVPFAHVAGTAEYGLQLHVHFDPWATPGHCHGEHASSHHCDSACEPHHSQSPNPKDHDDCCVFLPDSVLAATHAKAQTYDRADANFANCEVSPPVASAALLSFSVAEPDVLRHGCDLCVTLRTLRI